MLIHLDTSAVEAALVGDRQESALKAIENLLRAHDERNHLVSLDASARRLPKNSLSRWARGALEAILSTRKETGGLRNRLRAHIEVGAGDGFDGRLERRGSRHVFRQSVFFFEDYGRTTRSVLAAEDATDAALYVELGRAALFAYHEVRKGPALVPRGGGGSSLADAYAEALSEGRPTLAVADSDRDTPEGAVGGTARALRDVVSDRNGCLFDLGRPGETRLPRAAEPCPLACALILHARMLENVIQLDIYEHALTSRKPEELKAVWRRAPSRPWLDHVHLKTGLRWRDVEQKKPHEQPFWRSACADLGWTGCKQATECGDADQCRCEVVPALDPRSAESALAWMKPQPVDRMARLWGLTESSPAPAPPGLRELVDWLVSWGIAPASARAST